MKDLIKALGSLALAGALLGIGCGDSGSSGDDDGGDGGATSMGGYVGSLGGGSSTTGGSTGDAGSDTGSGGSDTGSGGSDTGSGGSDTGSGGSDTGSGGDDTGSGGDDTGAGGATADECPATQPDDGDACDAMALLGTTCDYGNTSCTCDFAMGGGTWNCGGDTGTGGAGGAGGDVCPANEPDDGDACTFAEMGTTCSYGNTDCTCENTGGFNLAWNCGGATGTGGSAGGGSTDACPANEPDDGDSCDMATVGGETCTYGGTTCTCEWQGGGTWNCTGDTGTGGSAGGGSTDACPANEPTDGGSCDMATVGGETCTYGGTTCTCEWQGGGTWNCTGGGTGGSAGAGTGGTAGDGGAGGAGGATAETCPSAAPGDGDDCDQTLINTTCDYGGDGSCTCEGGMGGPSWNCTGGGSAGASGTAGAAGGQGGPPGPGG